MKSSFWYVLSSTVVALCAVAMSSVWFFEVGEAWAANQEADDTLAKVQGSQIYGPDVVWSQGSTTDYVFHPLSPPMPSGDVIAARVDTLMDQDTGNFKLRPALRYSFDGTNWDNSQYILSSYQTTTGVEVGTSFIDLTSLGSNPKTWMQFGVQVANESGGSREFCKAAIRVQVKRT
jgi:hypothetical protein